MFARDQSVYDQQKQGFCHQPIGSLTHTGSHLYWRLYIGKIFFQDRARGRYLQQYLEEVITERKEREEWNKK